jgi:hypothetical protein
MKISTILDHIDSGHMALPEFQPGYAWNRDQVREEASGKLGSRHRSQPLRLACLTHHDIMGE